MMIFDSFPSYTHAEAFRRKVGQAYGLPGIVHVTPPAISLKWPYPFNLAPPIVAVERPDSSNDDAIEHAREQGFANDTQTGAEIEAELEKLALVYQGKFVGT